MPFNNTARAGLQVFSDALSALKNKVSPSHAPTGVYEFQDEKITPTKRQKANNAAVSLLRQLQNEPGLKATAEQKVTLSRYTGKGGNLEVEGVKGSQYEYYTPVPLANALWDLLKEHGFDGGAVLDPCAGTGIFAAGRPESVLMQSVELNDVSGGINALVNDQANHNVIVSPFEKIASQTQDNVYDAVITNVPFGSRGDRGDNARHDIYSDDDLDSYFVKRSIDKLKHGKLAVFIAHPKLLTGAGHKKFRQYISLRAELVGAYRLPNKVFQATGADVVTDVLVFRKHTEELTQKIENLYDNGSLQVLQDSRILDADIIDGRYYKAEGQKNVLGQSTIVKHAKFKTDVEAVLSDESLPNILKLIRRFPDSRINYGMLELTEMKPVLPIQEGDIRVIGGTTFEYQDGKWISTGQTATYSNAESFSKALTAFMSGMTYVDLMAYQSHCVASHYKLSAWAGQLIDVVQSTGVETYAHWLVQFALYEALQAEAYNSYAQNYPKLTSALKGIAGQVGKKPYKHASVKTLVTFNSKAFDKNSADGLSAYWYGSTIEIAQALDAKGAYENAIYMGRAKDFMVSVDEIRQTDPNFDPLANEDYAISGDGQYVTLNRDYYTGNHGEFLQQIDAQIEAATDPKIRAKLVQQRKKSFEHVDYVDVANINLGLRATNIDIQVKSDFLSLYGGDAVTVDEDGRIRLKDKQEPLDRIIRIMKRDGVQGAQHRWVQTFFLNRILDSVNNNVRLTLKANKDEVSKQDHDLVFKAFLEYANELDATFSAYLKANIGFMEDLDAKVNDPMHKEMQSELDTSPVEVKGFAPKFATFKAMQTYQNAEVRRLSRRFEGITGFDVGLGKTLTSIAAAQNLHNIGVKKRTLFVVPSHTISKWYRDMQMSLDDYSDVLVIGLKGNTLSSVNSSHYGADLNLLLSEPYRKILITSDAFTMIPLRDRTIEKYYESKKAKIDFSKDKDREKWNAFIGKKKEPLQKDVGRLPFFEDLNIDSIIFDEAQMFKNGDASEGFGNFQSIKGLSLLAEAQLSDRAISAKIKSEYVRGTNPLKDGVVLLSATPVTNSPSEILTMLSLAIGEKKAKNMLGGAAIDSVDDFLSTFAHTESISGVDLLGAERADETFTGFKNVELLKNVLHSVGNIQTARENDLKIPAQEDVKTNVSLGSEDRQTLADLKRAYNIARQMGKGGPVLADEDDIKFLHEMMGKLGESETLIGHPFNLITKMQDLILMGSESVLSRAMYVNYLPEDQEKAQKVIDDFNKKPVKVTSTRSFPLVDKADVKIKKRGKTIGDADELEITVRAFLDEENNRIGLTANDTKAIAGLMTLADKAKLALKPKLSSKMQALIDNVKTEMATPKHNGHAKQIIFCDTLAMHHIIKQALIEYCGVEKSRIAILNAAIKPDGSNGAVKSEDVQDIQDGFATDKYTIVIANKKADTGIDLQKGTQAIHHLTTGWTPDSLQQRNGRGVRQGNEQERVNVYMYSANGSFDEYKLHVINGKSDWINQLMNKGATVSGTLQVSSELTDDDYDLMIQADSAEAIEGLLKQRQERENQARHDRAVKHTDLLIKIAKKAASQADRTESSVAQEIIIKDYEKYITLMRRDAKAEDAAERNQILEQKQAIVSQYDSYLKNNSVENWDRGLKRKAEEKGQASLWLSSLHHSGFEVAATEFSKLDEQILNSDTALSSRAKASFQSLKRMADSTREQLLKYADSPFTDEERAMLLDGTAVLDENQQILKHGDLLKAEGSNGAIYGMRVIAESQDYYTFTESFVSNRQPIEPHERDAAIQSFIAYETQLLKKNEVFSYGSLNSETLNSNKRFSRVYPEIQTAVEEQLKAEHDNWIHQSSVYNSPGLQLKSNHALHWPEITFPQFFKNNLQLATVFNAPFSGIIESIELGDAIARVKIPNTKADLVQRKYPMNLTRLAEQIFSVAETEKIAVDLQHAESIINNEFMYYFAEKVDKALSAYYKGSLKLLYPHHTVLTDDQKVEIAEYILEHALNGLVSSYTHLMEWVQEKSVFKAILRLYALDDNDPEVIVKQHVKLHGGMGKFKNIKITGVAFLGTGSFGAAFKSTYKDDMKAYADSIRKRCAWDNRNTRWVVEPEVMVWMMKQDWFNMNEVEFY